LLYFFNYFLQCFVQSKVTREYSAGNQENGETFFGSADFVVGRILTMRVKG